MEKLIAIFYFPAMQSHIKTQFRYSPILCYSHWWQFWPGDMENIFFLCCNFPSRIHNHKRTEGQICYFFVKRSEGAGSLTWKTKSIINFMPYHINRNSKLSWVIVLYEFSGVIERVNMVKISNVCEEDNIFIFTRKRDSWGRRSLWPKRLQSLRPILGHLRQSHSTRWKPDNGAMFSFDHFSVLHSFYF